MAELQIEQDIKCVPWFLLHSKISSESGFPDNYLCFIVLICKWFFLDSISRYENLWWVKHHFDGTKTRIENNNSECLKIHFKDWCKNLILKSNFNTLWFNVITLIWILPTSSFAKFFHTILLHHFEIAKALSFAKAMKLTLFYSKTNLTNSFCCWPNEYCNSIKLYFSKLNEVCC